MRTKPLTPLLPPIWRPCRLRRVVRRCGARRRLGTARRARPRGASAYRFGPLGDSPPTGMAGAGCAGRRASGPWTTPAPRRPTSPPMTFNISRTDARYRLLADLRDLYYGAFGGAVQDESETAISLNLTIPPSRSCRRRRPSLAHHLPSVCVLPPKELTERCAMAASLSSRVGLRTFHHVRGH